MTRLGPVGDGHEATVGAMARIEAVLALAEDFPIFPCRREQGPRKEDTPKSPLTRNGFHDATQAAAKIRYWWSRWPDALVGVPTGAASGLLVVDVDPSGAEWHREHAERLHAGRVHKTRRGHHLLYAMPAEPISCSANKLSPGVDVRAAGGYVIWWPSEGLAATGDLDDIGPLPEWLLTAIRSTQRANDLTVISGTQAAPVGAGAPIPNGSRNDALARVAGKLRRDGLSATAMAAALYEVNRERCHPPLPDHEVAQIASSIERYAPSVDWFDLPPLDSNEAPDLSHDQIALELSRAGWRRDARFVNAWGRWLFWDGHRWAVDEKLEHMTRLREYLRRVGDALIRWAERKAAREATPEKADALRQWGRKEAKALRQAPMRANIEATARSNPDLAATADQWDSNADLLGTPGGTVDLRTGELRDAQREDFITRLTAVTPAEPGAPAPLWTAVLERAMGGDPELIAFMQRLAGYSLTGHTSEHRLPFWFGTGANGKSTVVNSWFDVAGDYARRCPAEMLLDSPQQRHPTDLAGLRGARLVVASELPAGRAWNESVIKDLTGGDTLTARFMRQDFFDFKPQFTLLILGNHQPSIRGVDEAMRRRILLVPFAVTIPPAERDPDLADKLRAEYPAILRWMIDGAVDWYRKGLAPPESVTAASEDYLDSEDMLGEFLADCCEPAEGAFTLSRELYRSFRDWCEARGLRAPWSQHALTRSLKERGLAIHRRTEGSGLLDFSLRPESRAGWELADSYRKRSRGD